MKPLSKKEKGLELHLTDIFNSKFYYLPVMEFLSMLHFVVKKWSNKNKFGNIFVDCALCLMLFHYITSYLFQQGRVL